MMRQDPPPIEFESNYAVWEACLMLDVCKSTIYNWLHGTPERDPVIPKDGWFKLPVSGQIRIKGWVLKKLQDGEL